MPDFTPDTSIYRPQNQMDIGSMLNIVQGMRNLNTQSGIADAIRANSNDPTAAFNAAARNPNVMMGPGDVTNFVHAQAAKSELARYYIEQVGKGVVGLYNNPKPTEKDWNRFQTTASQYINPQILKDAHDRVVRPDGSVDKDGIADFWGQVSGGQPIPTVPTVNPETQQPVQVPGTAPMYHQGPTGVGGPQGTYGTQPAPFQAATQKEASDAQMGLQRATSTEQISNQRQMLTELTRLSREAAEGPTANWDTRWSKLMTRMGMPQFATLNPQQVGASENFNKIAERLVQQMAVSGGHPTNDFLQNAYSSNPNLEYSRGGREDMISWLQGLVDAQNVVGKNWQSWLNQHPGGEGQYYRWGSGQVSGGMDMSKFDTRVFQFNHMTDEQRQRFLSSMTDDEKRAFLTHHRDYAAKGWFNL